MDITEKAFDTGNTVVQFAAGQTMVFVLALTQQEVVRAIQPWALWAAVGVALFNLSLYVPTILWAGAQALEGADERDKRRIRRMTIGRLVVLLAFSGLAVGLLLSLRYAPPDIAM